MDALERRLAEVERVGGRPHFGARPAARTAITTPVNRDCTFETCERIALSICKGAGFARGVPAELGGNGVWTRLVSATCLD